MKQRPTADHPSSTVPEGGNQNQPTMGGSLDDWERGNYDIPKGKDAKNTERFIEKHILHDPVLTDAAKEFMVNKARSHKGPWRIEADSPFSFVQDQGTITLIDERFGNMSFYYMPGLPHPEPKIERKRRISDEPANL